MATITVQNSPNLAAWVADLRSAKRKHKKQIRSRLKKKIGKRGAATQYGYCCLGILCETAGLKGIHTSTREELDFGVGAISFPPPEVYRTFLGMGGWTNDPILDIPSYYKERSLNAYSISCTFLNDAMRLTFDQIADLIEYFGIKS